MRKKISAMMIGAVILSVLLIPTVLAEKPTLVSGTWSWGAVGPSFRDADGNTFMSATEIDVFTGTFNGAGEGPFTVTIRSNGHLTGLGRTTFTGTVGSKSGTLVIQWTGNTRALGRWDCKWVILSGTGDLVNLRGSGRGVETAPGSYILVLSGKIHFNPS